MNKHLTTLPCKGYTSENFDYGLEFDCAYPFDSSCEDCVCNGGNHDPRYTMTMQPKKPSKFILATKDHALRDQEGRDRRGNNLINVSQYKLELSFNNFIKKLKKTV